MRRTGIVLVLAALAAAQEVQCVVAYVAADAVYVDAGAERGLAAGDLGVVRRGGVEIAAVEVVSTSKSQARLRVVRKTQAPAPGDRVVFNVREREPTVEKTVRPAPQNGKEFVPLLERQKKTTAVTGERNIFHGSLRLTEILQVDRFDGDYDFSTTLLGTDGMLDRIGGSAWSLRWSGLLSYRAGPAFDQSTLEGGRLDLYEFSFSRRLGPDSYARIGRFVPRTLPSAGYFDGVDGELGSRSFRVGGALGFKPTREDLQPSADEPTALAYATWTAGTWYSGTVGVLASTYKGDFDRAALLFDQFVKAGRFRARASGDIEFDTGAAMFNSGTRLRLFDSYAAWDPFRAVTVRAGAGRWERLDTRAERDALPFVDPTLFEDGFWRGWIGLDVRLSARFRLDGEVTVIDTDSGPRTTHWRATLSYDDPFGARGGTLLLTVYNLEGALGGTGLGGRLDGHLPLANARWMLHPSLGFRAFDAADDTAFDVTDVRLFVEYFGRDRWTVRGGLTVLTGTALDSLLLEFGVSYRW